MSADHDAGDEDRGVVDTCPFCGCDLFCRLRWITPLMSGVDEPWSFEQSRPFDPSLKISVQQLETCNREACRAGAKAVQTENFKTAGKKQIAAFRMTMQRQFDPAIGFKDRDRL